MSNDKNPKRNTEFDEKTRRQSEQRENNPNRREKEILQPGSKEASLGNQGHGYRGAVQQRTGEWASYGDKHTENQGDIYDISDERHGGGMDGRISGTRFDGGTPSGSDFEEEEGGRVKTVGGDTILSNEAGEEIYNEEEEQEDENSGGVANRHAEGSGAGKDRGRDEDRLVHEKQ